MFKSDKAKNAGKFIVIMLCFAILFFLLLPFLEDPAHRAAAQNKKATPQIFTSNPLSDLVRKVYAMFTKHAPKPSATQGNAAAYAAGFPVPPVNGEDPLYAYARPEDAAATGGAAAGTEAGAYGRSAAYFPEAYDEYGDAGFVNEEGEWVLVRQTAPEAGPRGMHDVNSTDPAYDKWLQLERAAKYNPSLQPRRAIPESKWARFFRPIKNFLGLTDSVPDVYPADGPKAFALASAARGGRAAARRASGGGYPRASMPGSLPGSRLPSSVNAPEGDTNLAELLNPEEFIDEVAEGLKELAANNLDKKQQKDFNSMIDKQKEYHKELMRQQLRQSIIADAQDQEPKELLEKTQLCSMGASSLYRQNNTMCPTSVDYVPEDKLEQFREQGQQKASENQQKSLEILSDLAGKPLKQENLKMVVILGKTDGTQNPMPEQVRPEIFIPDDASEEEKAMLQQENENRQRQDKVFKEFYDYMTQQKGCNSQPCYWVATDYQKDPGLSFSIQSAGMEFEGDPLKIRQQLEQGFMESKLQDQSVNEQQLRQDMEDYNVYYIPYTQEDMAQLNQRNNSAAPHQKPQDPFTVYVPSAANAADMLEVLPNPGVVVYDNNAASILDLGGPAKTPAQRGDRIRDLLVKRAEYAVSLIKEHTQDLSQQGYSAILRNSNDAIRKQIQKEGLTDKDDLMGLSSSR